MWRFPLVRVLLFFISGILLAHTFRTAVWPVGFLAVLLILAAFVFPKARWLLIMALFSISLGYFNVRLHDDLRYRSHYVHKLDDRAHSFTAAVHHEMRQTDRYERYVAEISTIDGEAARGKMLVGIRKGAVRSDFMPGDVIGYTGVVRKNGPPQNPGQFNYARYLEGKSIHATIYLKAGAVTSLGKPEGSLSRMAAKLHDKVEKELRRNGMAETELQVLLALILGKQQDIPKETLQDYQYAGAVHILSVSGLHVGLLLGFVYLLLSPFPKTRNWNALRFITVIVFLWGFAIIAGLSPSVIRSATMFSFVAAGALLRKDHNILHTLFVSMLLILVVEPSFLFDAGFQLSYLSLFFIIWLQPFFDRLYHPENKAVRYVWSLLTVSFSAQLGVLPLSLYYFHQFPGLFFITNLVILPMLGLIMAGGLIVVVCAACSSLPDAMARANEYALCFVNGIIREIGKLESFVFTDVPYNVLLLVASYLFVLSLACFMRNRDFGGALAVGLSVILFQAALFCNASLGTKREFMVFHLPRKTAIVVRDGSSVKAYQDSIGNPDRTIRAYVTDNFIADVKEEKAGNTFYFHGRKILRIDSSTVYVGRPDIIVLTQSPRLNLERLLLTVAPDAVVADGSNYKSYVARWKATCHKMKIPFHATAEKGFYKLE